MGDTKARGSCLSMDFVNGSILRAMGRCDTKAGGSCLSMDFVNGSIVRAMGRSFDGWDRDKAEKSFFVFKKRTLPARKKSILLEDLTWVPLGESLALYEKEVVVAEGVGEEGVQKVEQESSSELDPLPLDPPPPIEVRWKVADIMYKLTGRFKHYDIGWTSFGKDLDENRSTQISLVSFESLQESKSYFDNLKNFKDDRIVECYLIDDKGVMIALVDSDVETWVEEEYKSFIATNSSRTWWAHIQNSFKSIFRDILLALQFLFEKGAYCGDLANNISIINGKSAKLSVVKVAHRDLRDRIWEDIDSLRHLMETVLLKGYLGNLNKDMDQILGEVGVPRALSLFLGYLRDKDVRRKWDIPWLLDEAFFWGDVERHSFIRKMHAHCGKFKDEGFRNAMETLLGESNLNFFFTQGSTEDEDKVYEKVYEHGLKHQLIIERERKSQGRHYTVEYRDNIFLGVIAYSRNFVAHYNDHNPPVPLSTYDIVPIADKLFLGGCSMIRNSMAVQIFEMKQSGVNLSPFLSKAAY